MYRYYVSGCLLPRTAHIPTNRTGQRLSATRIEKALSIELSPLSMGNENALTDAVRKVTVLSDALLVEIDVGLALPGDAISDTIVLRKAERIDPDASIEADTLHLTVALLADRRGRTKNSPDTAMVAGDTKLQSAALVRKAHQRLAEMKASPLEPPSHTGMKAATSEWIRRQSAIGLLAPDIQKALLTGTAPAHVTPDWMLAQEWPVDWDAQRRMIGMRT